MQVGYSNNMPNYYIKDSKGDNISYKSKNYCELTAYYYIWKNRLKDDYIGIVHYRRYFCERKTLNPIKNILSYDKAVNILQKYDMIVPYKINRKGNTLKEDYRRWHHIKDYIECRKIINQKYPDYIKAFDKVSSSKMMYPCNMLITSKRLFSEYCEWLFDILFTLEQRIDISNYDDYNQRVFGFLNGKYLKAVANG